MLRQKHIPYLGQFIDSLYTSLPILSIVNFLSILIVLYTDIKPYLLEYTPWIQLWMFAAFLAGITAGTMFLIYKFVLPSVWTFRATQMFNFDSDIKKRLERIEKLLEERR